MTASKYNIWPLDKVNFVPRTDFLQSLVGKVEPDPIPTEEVVQRNAGAFAYRSGGIAELANYYIYFRDKGARLPKFTRWATGMFATDDKLQKELAKAGKLTDSSSPLFMSCDVVDILRSADTPHFQSCFKYEANLDGTTWESRKSAQWGNMPKHIAELTPGIAILGINDENGKYRGRVWVHHIQVGKEKRDAVCAAYPKGTLTMPMIKKYFSERGVEVYTADLYNPYGGAVQGHYVGGFGTKKVHHDVHTTDGEKGFTLVR